MVDISLEGIESTIAEVVTNPSTKWYAQTGSGGEFTAGGTPAKWVSWENVDGVRMRVVYALATGRVFTAFPDETGAPSPQQVRTGD